MLMLRFGLLPLLCHVLLTAASTGSASLCALARWHRFSSSRIFDNFDRRCRQHGQCHSLHVWVRVRPRCFSCPYAEHLEPNVHWRSEEPRVKVTDLFIDVPVRNRQQSDTAVRAQTHPIPAHTHARTHFSAKDSAPPSHQQIHWCCTRTIEREKKHAKIQAWKATRPRWLWIHAQIISKLR